MKNLNIAALALVAGFGHAAIASAGDLLRGPEIALGDGVAHSWVRLDGQDRPREIGVSISDEALSSLGSEMAHITIPLPEPARDAGYDHVGLDWMPHGHPPLELFSAAHFDVHFYMIGEAERQAIDPADPAFMEKAANEPARDFMPANYMPPPAPEPVPGMGVHWVDVTDPVISGAETFENILIYGAWDGAVTFIEPMVTRDLLASKKTVVEEVAEPASVAEVGYFPTRYRVAFDHASGTHDIVLEGLRLRAPARRSAALR